MKHKIALVTTVLLYGLAAAYLLGSFIAGSFTITEWEKDLRIFLSVIVGALFAWTPILIIQH